MLSNLILALILVILTAKLGAYLAKRLGQVEVLGEIIAGGLIGGALINYPELLNQNETLILLSEIGVIILLFEIGLESNLAQMLSLGWTSLAVACVGVICPFLLSYILSGWILTELSPISQIFVAATLTATSVGITARVFKDLNFLQRKEAQIVLGAAVLDDILGLIILAIVSGLAQTGYIDGMSLGSITAKALGFLFLAVFIGQRITPIILKFLSRLQMNALILSYSLVFCLSLAYLSQLAGLAPIVGAFCAGLILDRAQFQDFNDKHSVEDYIKPISYFLVPIFFVMVGIQINWTVFNDIQTIIAALELTGIAIIGKLASGLCCSPKLNRWIVGFGMVPRGEVGLIFASIGKSMNIINDQIYAIIVIMVLITTIVTPPILNALIRNEK